MARSYVQVTTTVDARDEAAELARAAVADRLAACAQLVGPIQSTYWWEDEIETAEEWMVLFKTTTDRFDELASLITDLHSYDTPEIIGTPVTAGSLDYLTWIAEQTEIDDEDDDPDVDGPDVEVDDEDDDPDLEDDRTV
ncbi:divalent-cation tolerance protein CutA [Actinomadura flavalba]|uniref:divalent-cation tolerance protein CutA n=1 Tax=Actinomadura flavalba TaxID=1120938 RepID=UPI00039A415F|nr:divalent-cation tolerance protein CutA [Actinomadura flavalba]